MTIKAIIELKKIHSEMGEVLKELEPLETGVAADYSTVTLDYKWLLNELKHRLITLKNKEKKISMSDVGAIGVILKNYREMLELMNNKEPTPEYEYGMKLIDLITKEIEKQGIDLEGMKMVKMKQCSPNMAISGYKDCKYWNKHCFSENADGTIGQWGECTKLHKVFRYVLGTTPPCEPIQTTLV